MINPLPKIISFGDGSTAKLRAGDTVYHAMEDETWLVLADTGRMVAWFGWPCGMESRANLVPRYRCSEAEHQFVMQKMRDGQHPLRHIIPRENGGLN